jgi:hypothetical protein
MTLPPAELEQLITTLLKIVDQVGEDIAKDPK